MNLVYFLLHVDVTLINCWKHTNTSDVLLSESVCVYTKIKHGTALCVIIPSYSTQALVLIYTPFFGGFFFLMPLDEQIT